MDNLIAAASWQRRLFARAAVLAALCLPTLHAGQARAITWLCSLSAEGTLLVCVADIDALEPNRAMPNTAAVTAVVNGTPVPLDPTLMYTVPLWTPPTEADFVELLARATICYRSPECAVLLAPSAWLGDKVGRAVATRAAKPRPTIAAS